MPKHLPSYSPVTPRHAGTTVVVFHLQDLTTEPNMRSMVDEVRSLDDLREFIHQALCEKENLLEDQFLMTEMRLTRRRRVCGLQFSLNGPRSVRLGAIWATDHNIIYFYDAHGVRYAKIRLRHRLLPQRKTA